jgi:FkbH-like protein
MIPEDSTAESGLVAIAATFVAEPIYQSLSFWLEELKMPHSIAFAPYNQVVQQLLDSSSLFATNRNGVNIVLARVEDWQRDQTDPTSATTRRNVEQNARDLVRALTAASTRSATPHLVFLCPPSPRVTTDPGQLAFFEQIERLILSELCDVQGVHVVTSAALTAAYPVADYYDSQSDKLAHVPYTTLAFTALGTAVARKMNATGNACYKVIVVDGDQTLWGGICGEDGPFGVEFGVEQKAMQEFLVEQHNAGMLVCLCSMNNEEDVTEVFRLRTEMSLKREHFAAWRTNWRAKSENIKSLAEELNVGLESIVFIDDDHVACAEVQAQCPEVLTLQLPQPNTIPSFLRHLWLFDRLKVTREASERTMLYRQQAQREQFREGSPTLKDFLSSLDLQIEISPLTAQQVARAAELMQRTNQFNLNTIRRSEAEIQALCQSGGAECIVVRVEDRFGDYGLVGLMIFKLGSDALSVNSFLLSCRALGRGVEHRMLSALGEAAKQRGIGWVEITYFPTRKNIPARNFLESNAVNFEVLQSDGSSFFRIPAEFAATLSFDPSAVAQARGVTDGALSGVLPPSTAAQVVSVRTQPPPFRKIAVERYDAEQIQKAISAQNRKRPELATAFVAPRSPMEKKMAVLWSELLEIDQIGVNDDFFNLGGHSLLAMQLLSRIREKFHVDLSVRTLFTDQFSLADLVKSVLDRQIEGADQRNITLLLRKIAELSDDEVKTLLSKEVDRGDQGRSNG